MLYQREMAIALGIAIIDLSDAKYYLFTGFSFADYYVPSIQIKVPSPLYIPL